MKHFNQRILKRNALIRTIFILILSGNFMFLLSRPAFSGSPGNAPAGEQNLLTPLEKAGGGYLAENVLTVQQGLRDVLALPGNAGPEVSKRQPISTRVVYSGTGSGAMEPRLDVIQQWQIHRPVSEAKLQDSAYVICREMGITSLQSYVGWAQLEPEQGKITYALYDPVVDQLRKHGLKWLPFLITGPYIATPEWFREEKGVDAVCLEHGIPIRIQSIWNPELRMGVRRFLELFKAHYEPAVIEALNLGISGNWGESIYPAGGGFDMQGVHTHIGWWCGDKYARTDFRRWLKNKYNNVVALNIAWETAFGGFEEVEPFLPEDAPSRRAVTDLKDWYTGSMTDYAEFWVKTAREMYPELPIYLCTGGDGEAALGADFSAQAKMCAKYNAGLRITNMSDDMLQGFAITRMVSSATRLYGGYYTSEPGGQNSPKGIAGRIFDIVAGGGRGAYFKSLYSDAKGATDCGEVFQNFADYLKPYSPELPVAALMPNSSMVPGKTPLSRFLARSAQLRDVLNFEFIDENMVSDGLLDRFKALVLLSGNVLEASTLEKLGSWVENGGVLFVSGDSYPLQSVEGLSVNWLQDPQTINIDSSQVVPVPPSGPVAFDEITVYSATSRKKGHGYTVVWPDGWDTYMYFLGRALISAEGPWQQLSESLDGQYDNVLVARTGKRSVYLLNNGDSPVTVKINSKSTGMKPRTLTSLKIRQQMP